MMPRAVLALAALLIVGLLLWRVDHLAQQLKVSEDAASQYRRSTESLRATIRSTRALLLDNAERDKKHTQELQHAYTENRELRRAVAAGQQRLRVRAACLSTTAGAAGLADAGAAELTADAGQDYFTLRDEISLSRQMILGLQDYITHTCRIGQTSGASYD